MLRGGRPIKRIFKVEALNRFRQGWGPVQRFNPLTSKMRVYDHEASKFVDSTERKAVFGLVSITSLNVNLLTPKQMSQNTTILLAIGSKI